MPTVKGSYEAVLIYSVKEGEEAVEALKEKFASLIAANAEAGEVDDWGKRKLAYPINYINEGYYVCVNFKSATDFPAELKRLFGINDSIIRAMVTVATAKKAAPVAEAAAEAPAAEEAAE